MTTPGPFDFAVLVLASGQVVDAWRNGSLFTAARADVEAGAAAYHEGDRRFRYSAMMDCPYCLSHWAAALALALWLVALGADEAASILARTAPSPLAAVLVRLAYGVVTILATLPIYALAVVRAGWIVNGLLPDRLRYDRGGLDPAHAGEDIP